jgi:dimethylargininase
MLVALTHVPSPNMHAGLRTFVDRIEIDHELARRQHVGLRRLLGRCGAVVQNLDENRALPDCAFVEDAAVVLDEIAILTSMGSPDRRLELPAIEKKLEAYRPVVRLEPPAHLEGGDVLRIGRRLLVGLSARTNQAGIDALTGLVEPHGYRVSAIPIRGALHLKTAFTALDGETLLVNPRWVDCQLLEEFRLLPVPEEEPWAGNVLPLGGRILLSAAHGRTADLLCRRGWTVEPVDLSEFAKAEAGITCLSLIFAVGG